MKLKLIFFGVATVGFLVGLLVWRLADHDLEWRANETFAFDASGHLLSGTLWLPAKAPHAAVVLVHGDGAQDRISYGGYGPLISTFLDQGIAVASWDKAGVGFSEGNWLHQSMSDRAEETRAALAQLGKRLKNVPLGAVGFSQAGWVLPNLSRSDADFLVLIGPAVSWRDQGEYFTRVRLMLQGVDQGGIDKAIADQKLANERAFGADSRLSDAPDGMSSDRWRFILKNRQVDSRGALAQLDLPLLAIWGADDLNVDAVNDAAIYRQALSDRQTHSQIIVWPDATHGLLKSAAYNWQLTEDWTWWAKLRFLIEGRCAFAPGALHAIVDWIANQDRAHGEAQSWGSAPDPAIFLDR